MRILIATPEAEPYVKTGGLADVAGSLARELRQGGRGVSLILPFYPRIRDHASPVQTGKSVTLAMGGAPHTATLWASDTSDVPAAYFLRCDELYGRSELYGTPSGDYSDNALRFAFFSRAVLESCEALGIAPDVIHCNDWQTGLLPLYLKAFYRGSERLRRTAVLFAIHNMGYQGIFDAADLEHTGLGTDFFHPEGIEFYGKLNYLKAGLVYADLLSTVSETYAREILRPEHGFGLEGVLAKRKDDLLGVVNGIDYAAWDPSVDEHIPARYSAGHREGKAVCKRELLSATGLKGKRYPLFGMVNRLSAQKGLDLFANAADELVGLGGRFVVLGKGDAYYQELLQGIGERHRGKVYVKVGFDETFARLIYAGCDFLLMPSRYEPCGLGQLIALRYGTIPVARQTGGLADTIRDYARSGPAGTGFLFADYSTGALVDAVQSAMEVFADARVFGRVVENAMKADFSWARSADRYIDLYEKAVERVRL